MSTLVMSLGMIAFFAVVMAIAWRRYQRHAAKAAERSQTNLVQLLMESEVIAAQSRAAQNNLPEPSNVEASAHVDSPDNRDAHAQARTPGTRAPGIDARGAHEHN